MTVGVSHFAENGQTSATLRLPSGQSMSLPVTHTLSTNELGVLALSMPSIVLSPISPIAFFPPTAAAKDASATHVYVPANFLAQVHALDRQETTFDPQHRQFVPKSEQPVYYQIRVYAKTIDDVPIVDSFLKEQGWTTQSSRTRIEEIQSYDRTLQLLVMLVGGIVFVSGVWTLTTVLSDNTARKQGALGILLLLGMSRWGILFFVIGRALLIGLLASGILIPLSLFASHVMTTYGAHCSIQTEHLALVCALLLGAIIVGVLHPAFRVSRLDPGSALVGKNLH